MSAPTEAASAPLTYRRDIDGLRAIAVLAVIGFHGFPTWAPGGFVGVDVFFVISGYLISHQLFAACDRGTFSIRDFYVRRIRRIFPALLLVLVATAAFGWIALTPLQFKSLQAHLAASAFFSNNLLLWYEAGYFDPPSQSKPLLHLWSLGVEEQFYIVWPWLIFWCWRRRLNRTTVIGIIAVASLLLSAAMVSHASAEAAFYLPHSRLWQLAAGAWLASITLNDPGYFSRWIAARLFMAPGEREGRLVQHGMAVIGMTLCFAAFVSLGQMGQPSLWTEGPFTFVTTTVRFLQHEIGVDKLTSAYPGWPALIPTVGTMLIVAAGPAAWLNRRLLGNVALVFIGLISYPLYLWHWPMLSFLKITEVGGVSRNVTLAAIGLSFVLATLSYWLIEKPTRRWVKTATPIRAVVVASGLVAVGIIAMVALRTGSLVPPNRVATTVDDKVSFAFGEKGCKQRFPIKAGYCQEFLPAPAPTNTVLWGDSHAAHLFPGLGARLAERGESLVHVGTYGCPPVLGIELLKQRNESVPCSEVNGVAFAAITAAPTVSNVVLAFRGGVYGGEGPDGATTRIGETLNDPPAFHAALAATVTSLIESHKHVTIVLPTPDLTFEMDECLGRPWSLFPRQRRTPCAVDKAAVLSQQAGLRRALAELAQRLSVDIVDPLTALCDERLCYAVADGQPLYNDNNHLGMAGSIKAATAFRLPN